MRGVCKIHDCGKPLRSAHYCAMHWNRFKRHGDPISGKDKVRHGMHLSPEYQVWEQMKQRCFNPKARFYKYYGGRGITVCERWIDFVHFYEDMGKKPTPQHTIERNDNDGNYEPDNCRWATRKEQAQNKRPWGSANAY